MVRKIGPLVTVAVMLTACDNTQPVVVIGLNGQTLKGTATGALSGGSFSVTDGRLTCSGHYDSWSLERTITMQAICSDGRKGIVVSTRDSSGISGHGTVTLTDGTQAQFIFGPAAANF